MSIAATESPTIKRPPNIVTSQETGATYTLGSPLGSGKYGNVYKALSKQNSPLAAKTNLYETPFNIKLFQKEGDLLALLKNAPHTLKMRECFPVTDKSYFILTERMDTPNVYDAFIRGKEGATPLLCKQVFSIARQLGEALHYCHRTAGIVHRDLKPENLFYNVEKDELTLIDFGLAEKISALTEVIFSTKLVVPRLYRSPEATLLSPYTDTLDLWSVGCILFELYTGFYLFPSDGEDCLNGNTGGKISPQTIVNHFHAFAARIGMPSEEWIVSSERIRQFYNQNPNTKQYIVRHKPKNAFHLKPWKEEIFAAAKKKNESKEEAQKLCDLIAPTLDYDFKKRINAEGLLKRIAFLYRAPSDLTCYGRARQSTIDPNEEHHSKIGKGDEEDRLGKVAAGQNMSNLTERGITGAKPTNNQAAFTKYRPPNIVTSDKTSATYALGSPLGEGSTGNVYKAFSKQNSPLAAKINLYATPLYVESIQREGGILALLKNAPHTLKMRECFSIADKSYLILTERMTVPNTHDAFIKGKQGATPLLCKQLFSIARQLGETLHYYHETAGIVHRDLKPQNLFYNVEKDELTIIDFGLAEKISALADNFNKTLAVSRWFRSPEATLARPYTNTIDLWSVGCVLFELYTGYALFPSNGKDFIDREKGTLSTSTIANHFHYFEARLGMPSQEWIAALGKTPRFFVQDPNTKRYILSYKQITKPHLRPWKEEVFAAAETKKESKEEAQKLCDLIEPTLDYDFKKRINAEGLLKRIAFLTGAKPTNNQAASTEDSKVETVT